MAEKDRIRKHQINIRLTETEYENAKEKAEYCGLSMSEFIRKQIMNGVIIKYERFDIKAFKKTDKLMLVCNYDLKI